MAVLGAEASIKRGAFGMDQSFGGQVRYVADGTLHESPHGFLGPCIGEGSQVGAGVSVGPGRLIAPKIALISDSLQHPTETEPGLYRVREGKMEPLS